jgi:hypothetical protein
MPITLVAVPAPNAAARLAILALRSAIPRETPIARNQIVLLPDLRRLSLADAAERLASHAQPLRCEGPQVQGDALMVQCEQITNRDQAWHALRLESLLWTTTVAKSQRLLRLITVLVDGRDEQLLVTGEAFGLWLAQYEMRRPGAGGPAYSDWVLNSDFREVVGATRPDYVYQFFGPDFRAKARGRITRVVKDGEQVPCARCGLSASTIRIDLGERQLEALCTNCEAAAFPPHAPSRWPNDLDQIGDAALAHCLSDVPAESWAEARELMRRWSEWTDSLFPAGVDSPPQVSRERRWIDRIRRLMQAVGRGGT